MCILRRKSVNVVIKRSVYEIVGIVICVFITVTYFIRTLRLRSFIIKKIKKLIFDIAVGILFVQSLIVVVYTII